MRLGRISFGLLAALALGCGASNNNNGTGADASASDAVTADVTVLGGQDAPRADVVTPRDAARDAGVPTDLPLSTAGTACRSVLNGASHAKRELLVREGEVTVRDPASKGALSTRPNHRQSWSRYDAC